MYGTHMNMRYVSDNDSFSVKLRKLRKEKNPYLSQARVAKQLGVARATYANYESGRAAAPFWFACAVASYFRVPIEELTENSERPAIKSQ